jgi:adenosine deaminase
MIPAMELELIRKLPKTDLHVHLDGSLRIGTLIELARERGVELPAYTESGLRELVFLDRYAHLGEYLEGFRYTVAVLSDAAALERAAFELCEDHFEEGVRSVEVRFAPQLHVRAGFEVDDVVRAVDRGLRRAVSMYNTRAAVAAGEEPRYGAAVILCALRYFTPGFSEGYRRFFETLQDAPVEEVYAEASLALARAPVRLRREGVLVVAFDLAGRERG